MKYARTLILIVASLVALLAIGVQGTQAQSAPTAVPTVTMSVGGQNFALSQGMVVKNAAGKSMGISISGNKNTASHHFEIVIGSNNGRDIVVEKVAFDNDHSSLPEPPAGAVRETQGAIQAKSIEATSVAVTAGDPDYYFWAKNTILCPFGVTADEVYVSANYHDDGSSVSKYACDHWSYDGSFPPYWDMYTNWWYPVHHSTSDTVYCQTWGNYDSSAPRNQLHTIEAEVQSWPGGDYNLYYWYDRLPNWITWPINFHASFNGDWYEV